LDAKKLLYPVLFTFIAGFAMGTLGAKFGSRDERRELRERLEQVNRDLNAAFESQREAAERASRLQTELQGITDHARILEEGTRLIAARAGSAEARGRSLAEQLNGIIDESGELRDGINRANGSLEESRILLDELGTLLRILPGNSGEENQQP